MADCGTNWTNGAALKMFAFRGRLGERLELNFGSTGLCKWSVPIKASFLTDRYCSSFTRPRFNAQITMVDFIGAPDDRLRVLRHRIAAISDRRRFASC